MTDKTLTEFIIEEQRRFPEAAGGFTALLNHIRLACKRVSFLVGRGALGPAAGTDGAGALDAAASEVFVRTARYGGHLAAILSSEMSDPYPIPDDYPRGGYLLVLDPLDGAGALDVNQPAGSIFAVLRAPEGGDPTSAAAFLQPGARQLCAGYAIYGPTTMLVLTVGRGVHGFTLDRGFGEFVLTHPDLRIPEDAHELAIDASNEPYWEPPLRRYVEECVAGRAGPRGADFRLRWIATPVPEVHRILVRGGVFVCPRDARAEGAAEGLRLLDQANPMAMLVEQAGGAASTGRGRLLDLAPASLREPAGLIFGSKSEIARIERYHQEHDAGIDEPFTSPLFRERSLFASA